MRRLSSTTIVLMALLLAMLAAAPGVSAQAPVEHPAVGVWLTDGSPDDATDPLDLMTIAPGGIVTVSISRMGPPTARGPRPASGAWMRPSWPRRMTRRAGPRRVRHDPHQHRGGRGRPVLRGDLHIEFPAAMAEAMGLPVGQQVGPGTVIGQRITVEPMGESVPFPGGGGWSRGRVAVPGTVASRLTKLRLASRGPSREGRASSRVGG